ncbi:MAG TPA: CRISPR-associated ring nuclease Csm6 [Blastocatellia bacterium]|nr:CRISPR-associated ring nuclease Csm6 [Blastocatellia bacterium]
MKPAPVKHILLCVAGVTPQIITETLYALTQNQGERVDEIRVITTLAGRDCILRELLAPRRGRFFTLCRDYGLAPRQIRFDETTITLLRTADGRTLEDIRTPEDNEHAANQIADIVRELTRDPDARLHASVAGGRKTMSVYLAAAMQLFGRAQDRLSHVLVSEEFESHPEFYYKPPRPRRLAIRNRQGKLVKRLSTAQAEIYLADIPFIRLRGALSDWLKDGGQTYGDFVRRAQEDLNLLDAAHELRINLRDKSVTVAGRHARLSEREMFIYALFAYLRQQSRGDGSFVTLEEIRRDDLDAVFRAITAARGKERPLDDFDLVPRFDFVKTLAYHFTSNNADDFEYFKTALGQILSKIKRKFEKAALPERYHIARNGERGSLSYGLQVPPDRITLR